MNTKRDTPPPASTETSEPVKPALKAYRELSLNEVRRLLGNSTNALQLSIGRRPHSAGSPTS